MRFCSTVTVAQLPQARSLADRVTEHTGERLVALILGRPALEPDEPFDAIGVTELGLRDHDELIAHHALDDLALALRPALLLKLLGASDEPLVYFEPAHELLASPAPLGAQLDRYPVLLSARIPGPLPEDGKSPTDADVRDEGAIDPGFVAVRAGPAADRFLQWWAQRARESLRYVAATTKSGSADQGRRQLRRLLDVAPTLHDGVALLDDPRLEVSGWNLHERQLSDAVTISLAGFAPACPHVLGERFTRITPAGDPDLAAFLGSYRERLAARGWIELPQSTEVGRPLTDDLVFSDRLLRLYVEALAEGEDFGDLFSPDGAKRFLDWVRAPGPHGGAAGISRYLYRVYRDRPDLPVAYPDLDGADGEQFAGWAWVFGRRELDIPDALLPPAPAHVRQTVQSRREPAVNVAGYFTGTLGLGEAARLYVTGLDAAGVPVGTRTVDAALPVDPRSSPRQDRARIGFAARMEIPDAPFNLICVNADELPRFVQRVGPGLLSGRHNIGVWAWETDVVPRRWDESFALLDEIWVYSRYIAENLSRVSPIPVLPVPPPVVAPETAPAPDLGLPDGFRFMFMFDYFSTMQRKNPTGVVEAFKRAFAPEEGPHLVVKTIHGADRATDHEALLFAARGRPDIVVIDRSLNTADKNGLLASCDCYVSLHRSEGWGLPLAECMAMGKPVIATAYSGSLDFMGPGNSYLVDYRLTQVGGDVEIYPSEGTWAEPDVDDAARQMRAVYDDQAEAHRRGARAATDITEQLSPQRVGRIARERLEHVLRAQPAPVLAPVLPSLPRRAVRAARARLRG